MSAPFKDLTGKKYHRWTVLKYVGVHPTRRHRMWLCQCDCGAQSIRDGGKIHTRKSCGCIRITHGETKSRKRGSTSKEYKAWASMKRRCLKPSNRNFKDYGGRGITVCQRWIDDFTNFLADVGRAPQGYSLDRIDNDGNYEPGNVRWASPITQANNRRKARKPRYARLLKGTNINGFLGFGA